MSIGNDLNKAELLSANALTLASEMAWFESVLAARLAAFLPKKRSAPIDPPPTIEQNTSILSRLFGNAGSKKNTAAPKFLVEISEPEQKGSPIEAPDWSEDDSFYAQFVHNNELLPEDRLVVMLALTPHLQPQLLNKLIKKDSETGAGDLRFGGVQGSQHGGFLPTVETALFLLAGNNLDQRLLDEHVFHPESVLLKRKILLLNPPPAGEPFEASQIRLSEDAMALITKGEIWQPQFSMDFPAKLLTTPLRWNDLVLNGETMQQLEFIGRWLSSREAMKAELSDLYALKPGFKALFYGPPGTGKTLTAALLGQQYDLDVFRIDLSMIVSKYIGETEKNLEKVFSRAEGKDWVLFFDEADALFGKRTNITDAHDKYANQEISYLLQRLENYPGLVILASNMQQNIDEAFTRRMQAIVRFPRPTIPERHRLWEKALSIGGLHETCGQYAADLAGRYDLTGAGIMNAVHYTALLGMSEQITDSVDEIELEAGKPKLVMKRLFEGIRAEYVKEGRSF